MPTGDSPNSESEAIASKNESVEKSAVEKTPDTPEKQTPEQTGERLKELAIELDTLLDKADKISIEQSNIEANLEGPVSSQLEKTAEVSSSPEVSAMRSKLAGLKLEMKNIEQSYSATLRMIETLKEANKESEPAKIDELSQEPKETTEIEQEMSQAEVINDLSQQVRDIEKSIQAKNAELTQLTTDLRTAEKATDLGYQSQQLRDGIPKIKQSIDDAVSRISSFNRAKTEIELDIKDKRAKLDKSRDARRAKKST